MILKNASPWDMYNRSKYTLFKYIKGKKGKHNFIWPQIGMSLPMILYGLHRVGVEIFFYDISCMKTIQFSQ